MRIEVIINIDNENREVYGFNLFELTAVFVSYSKQHKPKGKRLWTITSCCWDKYARDSKWGEPVLPDNIKQLALEEVKSYIKILTWAEWKK